MVLCERNMNVRILLYHQTDQARFSIPDYVLDYTWKLKLASQSVLFLNILAKQLGDFSFFPHVFSLLPPELCNEVVWAW